MPSTTDNNARRPVLDAEGAGAPDAALIGYARRLIARRYRVPAQEVDDVIATSMLDFIRMERAGRPCRNGLFLVIARRRACDFWRRRREEVPLEAAAELRCPERHDHLERRSIREQILRSAASGRRLDTRRLLGISARLLDGESFAEACRGAGLPRGSQGRYRRMLRDLLREG